MEATHCYNPSSNCNSGTLTLPVAEYSHTFGCSITGGFRYRGSALTGYSGTYFFADLCSGRIWGATQGSGGSWSATLELQRSLMITTFGEDPAGELYLSNYGSSGELYRLVNAASASPLLTVMKAGGGSGRITSSPTALECGSLCGARLTAGTAVTLTATSDSGSTFLGWTGDSGCAGGVVTMTADRSCTATFGPAFTDDPLVAGSTTIKAVHVMELRSRIDALRARAHLSPYGWTDPSLTATPTAVKALHVAEMRAALNEAYVASGRSAPSYTDTPVVVGDPIRAVHISDLRNAVLAIE